MSPRPRIARQGEVLKSTEPEDLLKFGLIPEFIGRLPVIATLEDLDEEALVKILVEPKNALVKQYQKLFDMEDVELGFSDEALHAVAKKAIERKTGARGLRSILEGILLDTMFDLPSMEGVDEVHIDKDVVDGRKDPVRVYAKKEKTASSAATRPKAWRPPTAGKPPARLFDDSFLRFLPAPLREPRRAWLAILIGWLLSIVGSIALAALSQRDRAAACRPRNSR